MWTPNGLLIQFFVYMFSWIPCWRRSVSHFLWWPVLGHVKRYMRPRIHNNDWVKQVKSCLQYKQHIPMKSRMAVQIFSNLLCFWNDSLLSLSWLHRKRQWDQKLIQWCLSGVRPECGISQNSKWASCWTRESEKPKKLTMADNIVPERGEIVF